MMRDAAEGPIKHIKGMMLMYEVHDIEYRAFSWLYDAYEYMMLY